MRKSIILGFMMTFFVATTVLAQWEVVWEDDFDFFDTKNWTKRWPWGSENADHLKNTWFPDNHVFVENGNLVIHASGDDVAGREWSSGIVNSRQKLAPSPPCRIVARVKVPSRAGCVPAFWLLKDYGNGESLAWPPEIDVFEFAPGKDSSDKGKTVWCTVHYVKPQGGSGALGNGGYTFENTLAGDYHEYEIQWFEKEIFWYVDGTQVYHVKNSDAVPDINMFLLFGMEVNDQPGWHGTPAKNGWDEYMYVDWVRVYEKTNSSVTETTLQPNEFLLEQNFPNPFNPSTTIRYSLVNDGLVTLNVFDLSGRVIHTLVDEHQQAGFYTIKFEKENLPSGTYLYRLSTGEFSQTRKMVLIH